MRPISSRTRRLLVEQLEDRRVLSGLLLGDAAPVAPVNVSTELSLTLPAVEVDLAAAEPLAVQIEAAPSQPAAALGASVNVVGPTVYIELSAAAQGATRDTQLTDVQIHLQQESGSVQLHVELRAESQLEVTVRGNGATNRIEKAADHQQAKLDRLQDKDQKQQARGEQSAKLVGNQNETRIQNVERIIVRVKEQEPAAIDAAPGAVAATEASAGAVRRTNATNQLLPPPNELEVHTAPPEAATDHGAGTVEGQTQTTAPAAAQFDASGVLGSATALELSAGIRLQRPGEFFEVEGVGTFGQLTVGSDERLDLQGGDLAAGTASISTAALDVALQEFVDGAGEVARNLVHAFTNGGMLTWLAAALVAVGAVEFHRRKQRKPRVAFATANLAADSTFSWMPGLPGSYSDEDA